MDPEDFEVLMTVFFETCKAVVESHRGLFAHHTGDGFTAYFGSPRTQGRNAHEAISCGRAVIEALSRQAFPKGIRIQVRIGIATGLVVFSTIVRQNNSSNMFAIGAPVHLAARIQALAPPGQVCIDATSYHLAHRGFEFVDLGVQALKGFAESTRVWQVGNPRPVEFRFEERRERLTPFVGRNRALAALDERWRLAQQGSGQTVLVTGEPGIGKSRLVFEFIERIALSRPPMVFQCLEDHGNEPLHPWIGYMRHAAQIVPNESLDDRRRKIGTFFDSSFPDSGWLRPFVLSLVAPGGDEIEDRDDASPTRKLDALRAAITDYVVEQNGTAPKIVVIEDVHWIDPSSEEILTSLIERVAGTPTLLLATCRQDKDFGAASPLVTHLSLDRLSTVQAVQLANNIVEGAVIAKSLLAHVVERSDGIPLYIEEMARTVSETGTLDWFDAAGQPKGGRNSDMHLPIPDTLQGTLLARLDSLGESKELAQMASVVGRQFEIDVVAKLAPRPKEELERDLEVLVKSGLVLVPNASMANIFEFKHALIREAAYNSLLRRDAVNLHSALARVYERDYPELRSTRPEMLAQHLTVSGRWLDAASLWLQAGLSAKEMGSTVEAMTRLDHCLQCLDSADSLPQTMPIRMRCQIARAAIINSHYGPTELSAHQALEEAAILAETLRDAAALIESRISLSFLKYNAADFAAAKSVANELIDYGIRSNNERASAIGMVSAGMCSFAVGEFLEARRLLEEALALLSRGNEGAEAYEGHALSYLGLTAHILGNAGEANKLCAVAIALARQRRANVLAAALGNSLYLLYMQGDIEQTRQTCNELTRLAEEKGFPMWYHHARFFLGWVYALDGDEAGLEVMEASMNRFRSANELVEQSFFYGALAERYLAVGAPERALENVKRGLDLVDRLGERFFEAPLLRLKAKCLGKLADTAKPDEISTLLVQADRLSKAQGAIAWY
jgi:predicted ATPase/class 3 adenylate cyclase